MTDYLKIPIGEITDDQLKKRCVDSLEHMEIQINHLRQCCNKGNFTPAPNLCFADAYKYFREDLKTLNVVVKELSYREIIRPFLERPHKKRKQKEDK